MSQKDKGMMPQTQAGLIRYFEASKESIKLKPEHIVGASIILIAVVLALRFLV